MAIGEPFYLNRGSSASSTSTLFLRISDQRGEDNLNDDVNLAPDLDSTTDLAVTANSSPYMRSSPQEAPSEASIHECPPESSSPFLSSSSSAGSSPYFPAIVLAESGCSSGSSSSNTDNSNRDSRTGILEELAVFSPARYNLWLPIKGRIFGSQDSRDEFSRSLYDRLLVVKRERERERAETSVNSQDGNAKSGSFYENGPFFSGQVSPQVDSLGFSGFSRTSSADETDIETPFFASPPRSDNVTPPKYRKRSRESDVDGSLCNDSLQDDKENRNYEQTPYRLIWGARSFEAYQNRLTEDWEYDAPPLKRQRTYIYPHRQEYASKPASLRRALSLKSDCEQTQDSASPYSDQELTPTEPTTPIASNRGSEDGSFLAYGVPIIAPPLDHVAALPISTETEAKNRIHRFLEKEYVTREADGLGIPYRQTVDDILLPQSEMWEELLAIGQSYREDAIDWLLHVLPAEPSGRGSTPASSFSSVSSQSSTSSCRVDLYDELTSSPETRFHAASIFLRFFYRVMSEASNLEKGAFRDGRTCLSKIKNAGDRSASFFKEGKELIIWDVAVASLALSVKFHRDVLQPLSPIFAREYLDLAHHRISFDDLETAHRDILSALSYDLGLTPQPLLDNLWLALPSLRQLFEYEGGWNHVMRETWLQLFDVISEPDILQFPLSSITVACLVEGIIIALVHNYDYRSTWRKSVMRRRRSDRGRDRTARKKRALIKAGEAVEGVIHDIQAATGVTDARLLECRSWLIRIRGIREVPSSY